MFCAVVPQTPVLAMTVPASGNVEDGTAMTLTCTTGSTLSGTASYRLTTAGTPGTAQGGDAFTAITASLSLPAYACEASNDGGTTWSTASAAITPVGESIWSCDVSVVLSVQAPI